MRRLDYMTITGILAGTFVVAAGVLTGSNIGLFWNFPSVLITVGGSFFTVVMQYDLKQIKDVFRVARQAFTTAETQIHDDLIPIFTRLARKARKEGLLSLEDEMDIIPDPLFAKGVQLMVDAIDPDTIRDILEAEIDSMEERHELGQNVFKTWAAMAPAFGMIGTLIGLVQMLALIDTPDALGPGMAVALLTTLYGSLMANMFFTPIAGKLALRSREEVRFKTIILEGIICIQSGMNPRIIEEKLSALIPPGNRKKDEIFELNPEVSIHAAS